MMIGCAATGLSERDEHVRVTAAACASDRDKDVEILVLRHQLRVLERQLGTARPRFSRCDRAFLAALLHWLPRGVLSRVPLLVRPETVLRWHRDLLARRHTARSRPVSREGRAPSAPSGCWCGGPHSAPLNSHDPPSLASRHAHRR